MTKLVGIVGGAGAEGAYFADIFQQSGLEVVISDINTEKAKELSKEMGYRLLSSEELASKSDLVVFSLPIDVTVGEIQKLAPLVNGAMTDLTSVKKKAVDAMIEYSKPETEVFSVHAMYRPTVSPWGQNVIMIPGKPKEGGEWFNTFKQIMEKRKANVSVLESAERHDELSAALQVLPHVVTYAYLQILDGFTGGRIRLSELQQYSTLFFRLMMETTGRVVANPNSGSMYGSIQAENPNTELIYDGLIRVLEEMKKAVTGEPNVKAISDLHRGLHRFLGDYAQAAAERTDRLMGHPLGLQLVYERDLHDELEKALSGFKGTPGKYKEQLETVRVPEGELAKLHRGDFVLARQAFYKVQECEAEGNYAFYIANKKIGNGKRIRFSPIIPEDLEKALATQPGYLRIQMYNKFQDPFLNLFNTWKRNPKLYSLGRLVAYKTN